VFRVWDHQFGGGLRRKAVVGQLSELAELLREPHPQALRRRLFKVTAKVAIVAGHMSGDSGRDQVAYRYFGLALDAARESGDDDTGARAVNATARCLLAGGRAAEAAGLLNGALGALRGASPEAAALLVTTQAWAQARLGRYDGVARALEHGAALVADGGSFFGPAEVAGISGACFEVLALRDGGPKTRIYAERAAGHIMTALASREPFYVRSRVLDLLGLASVRLCQQEADEAMDAGERALEQVIRLRSARAGRRAHRLAIRALERFPDAGRVAEFADRVRAQVPVA
jgi:hypothetical protein